MGSGRMTIKRMTRVCGIGAGLLTPLAFAPQELAPIRPATRTATLHALAASTPAVGISAPAAPRPRVDMSAVAAIESHLAPSAVGKTSGSAADMERLAYAPAQVGTTSAGEAPTTPSVDAAQPNPLPQSQGPVGLREAIDALRIGDDAAARAALETADDPIARLAIQWAMLRLRPQTAGINGFGQFLAAHADWPASGTLRRRTEEILWADKKPPETIEAFFADRPPATPLGKLALARALLAHGKIDAAAALARDVWRDADIPAAMEPAIVRDFGDYLTWADHKWRSDRMFYKGNSAASLRAAALAGPEIVALARARENVGDALVAALPAELRDDPSLLFARIQKLRAQNKIAEAARVTQTAPRDPELLVNGDEWWLERRLIARKLLDLGDAKSAFDICANHSAASRETRVDAEFHAGWIALRFLFDPTLADVHFAKAAVDAETPISTARIDYWRARTAEARGDAAGAVALFRLAAKYPTAFYGQLALARLGGDALDLRAPSRLAQGDERSEAVRVVEMLESIDARDLASPLATEIARSERDEAQLAALGEVLSTARDAKLALTVGKLASQRGYPFDELAFPTFGVPAYEAVDGSAPDALVYAIARQESAFEPRAVSSAGAKGLMQMMPATARRTAQHKGLAYDDAKLTSDPAFNAKLGAAHLGELLAEHKGSLILSFAAYNAGEKRVREWIAAHGDPRDPKVDPIDWIELIPIAETRNYVQRIAENLEVYRARMANAPNGEKPRLAIDATLRDNSATR